MGTKYKFLRPSIQTGDVILWQGNSIVDRAIRLWSRYSHASLVVRLDKYAGLTDRVFLVESLPTGLELTLLSDQLKDYDGKAFLYSVNMTQSMIRKVTAYALLECATNRGYDYPGLFSNLFGRISMDAHRYICSEWVWFAWERAGLVKPTLQAPRPGDIPKWYLGGVLTEITLQ